MKTIDYNQMEANSGSDLWLRRYSKFMVAATLILIFAGSLVTSTGTGLSVPDWPSTYGHFMFSFPLSQMVGGIFYEHGHRLIASTIGFLTVVLCLWTLWREKRRWVRVLACAALSTVIFQGLLGGLTVLLFFPAPVSTLHAVVAQTFFVLLICFAYTQSRERNLRLLCIDEEKKTSLSRLAFFVSALIYCQLILGAFMRHNESGLAVYDFPRMAGSFFPQINDVMLAKINSWRFDHNLPPVQTFQVVIHLAHRFGAVVVTFFSLLLVSKILRNKDVVDSKIRRNAIFILLVLLTQFALGAFSVLTMKNVLVASFHVVNGATLLGLNVLLVMRLMPCRMTRSIEGAVS